MTDPHRTTVPTGTTPAAPALVGTALATTGERLVETGTRLALDSHAMQVATQAAAPRAVYDRSDLQVLLLSDLVSSGLIRLGFLLIPLRAIPARFRRDRPFPH